MRQQMGHQGVHDLNQRLRPDADQQHHGRQQTQHREFPPVDILQAGHAGVGHVAEA